MDRNELMDIAHRELHDIKDLEMELSDLLAIKSKKDFAEKSKRYNFLKNLEKICDDLALLEKERQGLNEIIDLESECEMVMFATEEKDKVQNRLKQAFQELYNALFSTESDNDSAPVLLEIKAGTGGEEASLFCRSLVKMYQMFSSFNNLECEIVEKSESISGGYKEILLRVEGKNSYKLLKFEGGGHRVQRIPVTESQGRVHTSLVTVSSLVEVEDSKIDINNADLTIETFRSGGAGGQHVNTTDSAVRITYVPMGIVVKCEDQRSQHSNKERALKILKSKIHEKVKIKKHEESRGLKSQQAGSGDRGERIRTYNFPQNRLTDHRINKSWYNLDMIMEGYLSSVLESLSILNSVV